MKEALAFLIYMTLLLTPTWSMQWDSLSQGDKVAQELLSQLESKKKGAGPHPFSKGVSGEAALSPEELKGKAQALSTKDAAAQMIFNSADSRTQFKIDPQNDPLVSDSESIRANALEVIGGKGTKITVVQHNGKDETLTCEEAGDPSLESCTRSLVVNVIKTKVKKEWVGTFFISKCSNAERWGHYLSCGVLRQAFFKAKGAISGFAFKSPGQSPLDVNATLNITGPFKACVTELATPKKKVCFERPGCDATVPSLPFKIDQIQFVTLLKHPSVPKKLHMAAEHMHQYNSGRVEHCYTPYVKVDYEEEVIQVLPDEWSSNCPRLEERVDQGLCTYDSKVCTQGKQTRLINGVPITRDCWEETYTYSCEYPAKNDCGPLRARGCAQISSICKQKVGSTCVVYTQTYQCKGSTTSTDSITGGQTPFCLDGNCRDQGYEANDEMMSSLAQLTLLKEMQGQGNNTFIFKGEDDRCSKCVVSFKDCCGSGKGWGKSLGLTDCSAEERALKKKRDAGFCHYVGTYCAEKLPLTGVCLKKKSTYCCFGSKLLKAFHEQGRPQLRLGWGSAEEPICRGFTIEEIQKIDFSKLDLREVYEELMKKFKPAKMQDIGKKIGERIEIIKHAIDPKKKQFKQGDGA